MKKFDTVKILNGKRKGQNGLLLSAIQSEGEETVVVEFENEEIETFYFKDIEVINK